MKTAQHYAKSKSVDIRSLQLQRSLDRKKGSHRKRTLYNPIVKIDNKGNKEIMKTECLEEKLECTSMGSDRLIKISVKIPTDKSGVKVSNGNNTNTYALVKQKLKIDVINTNNNSGRGIDLEAPSNNEPNPKYLPSQKVYAKDEENVLRLAAVRRSVYGKTKELFGDYTKEESKGYTWHYFVHFLNWNSRFDMWVAEEDIYPNNKQSSQLSAFILESIKGIKSASKLAQALETAEKTFWTNKKRSGKGKVQSKCKDEKKIENGTNKNQCSEGKAQSIHKEEKIENNEMDNKKQDKKNDKRKHENISNKSLKIDDLEALSKKESDVKHSSRTVYADDKTKLDKEKKKKTIKRTNENASNGDDLDSLTKVEPDAKYLPSQRVYAKDEENVLRPAHIRRSMYGPTKELLGDDMKVKERLNAWHYFVHFLNWNARFDMWVVEENVYPDDEQSRELSAFILKSIRGIKSASKLEEAIIQAEKTFWAGKKQSDEDEIQKCKKVKIENEKKEKRNEKRLNELHERSLCDPMSVESAQIQLSVSLKKILVDEWEAITQLNLLPPPCPLHMTVDSVLNRYLETKLFLATEKSEEEEWSTAIKDLFFYFDSTLPNILYPQETLITSGPPRSIYSCQYLLRLLTKLPSIINPEEKSFIFKMCDLERYLTKNQIDIFQQSYKK